MVQQPAGDSLFRRYEPRLADPEAEQRFRNLSLDSDRRRAKALILIAVLFHAASIPSDLILLGTSDSFTVVFGIRVTSVALGLLSVYFIHLRRGVELFDLFVFTWALSLAAGIVAANALLPADYTVHIAWDVLLALGTLTVIPMSFGKQMLVASVIAIGNVILFAGHKVYPYPSTLPDVTLAFACAGLIGGFASWEMHRWRRELFLAFEWEKDAREKFELAQAEIQTLRGIISICASCKKIRTDEGSWRQVEAYVRDHSEAEFSHSICPECSKAIYGDDD